jgi:hypothetical protein
MKKMALQFAIGLLFISTNMFGQWGGSTTTSGDTYRFGNVGIGTSTPSNPLTIVSGGSSLALFQNNSSVNTSISITNAVGGMNLGVGAATPHPYIWSNTNSFFIGEDGNPTLFVQGMNKGNVGIGTSTPNNPLTVVSGANSLALFQNSGAVNSWVTVANATGGMNLGVGLATPHPYIWSNTNSFFIGEDGHPTVYVTGMNNGNVGIGTTNPGSFKLAVEGKIGAREVQVTLANPFPDYVFDSKYKLRDLASLESYINQNKHLPNVPSAAEVEKNGGIELGSMNAKLLEKVEELTLYIIEINKKVEKLEKENEALKKSN